MASISATILKHHKKQNGTWNVKIRISQRGKSVYLDTSIVAKKDDLDTKLRLKKVFIDKYVTSELNRLRGLVNSIGSRAELMTAEQLKSFLSRREENMDFFDFCEEYLEKNRDKKNTIIKRKYSIDRLKEFVKTSTLSPLDIKSKFLNEFQDFLKIPLRKDKVSRGFTVKTILMT